MIVVKILQMKFGIQNELISQSYLNYNTLSALTLLICLTPLMYNIPNNNLIIDDNDYNNNNNIDYTIDF